MNPSPSETLRVERVLSPPEQARALELVFAHLAPEDCARRIEHALSQPADAAGPQVWAVYQGQHLATAALMQVQPGRTADVWPPRTTVRQPGGLVRVLLSQLSRMLAQQQVCRAQVLLETDQGTDAELLTDLGYRHAANLLYMVSLADISHSGDPARGLEYVAYSPSQHARLAAIVERTYAGSLDCQNVPPQRDIEDVLTGYRHAGPFDPARWLIAMHGGEDVGCLLLADYPAGNQWELTYMGVVAEQRGRGFGLSMVRHAQWLARLAGRERLTLAVDVSNEPAVRIYAAAGFVVWDQRSAFVLNVH